MVKRFVRLDQQKSPLKEFIMSNIDTALGIQNDADELFTGETLNYLRHCVLKPGVQAVLAPAIAFKKNYHWLQHTSDMQCLKGSDIYGHTHGPLLTSPFPSLLSSISLSTCYSSKYQPFSSIPSPSPSFPLSTIRDDMPVLLLSCSLFCHPCFVLLQLMFLSLPGRDINRDTEALKGHLWRGGPTVWPLSTILAAGHILSIHSISHPINYLSIHAISILSQPLQQPTSPSQVTRNETSATDATPTRSSRTWA